MRHWVVDAPRTPSRGICRAGSRQAQSVKLHRWLSRLVVLTLLVRSSYLDVSVWLHRTPFLATILEEQGLHFHWMRSVTSRLPP